MAVTQFIAHDREVYDVAWLPNSTVIFVSVGVDSSLRAFDLRNAAPKDQPPTGRPPSSPLLHITFKPGDPNYISTFHQDGSDIQILDMLRIIIFSKVAADVHRAPASATWRTSETTSVQNRCRSTPSDGRFI
ncbi:hypothetical protein BGY98DRAFT_972486 [Russula aff. rugulosa BPL654]|nr:hypothetical protein BGY98DRAFT_972486 [Russula aff. rugulosa BPL654]